jgi:hypothetical protein
MKPSFNISKNSIITALIGGILVGVTVTIISVVGRSGNEEKVVKTGDYDSLVVSTYDRVYEVVKKGIETLQSDNEQLVREKDSVQRQNSQLKKKVDYYYEYYRRNQPVGMEVAEDTALYIKPISGVFYYDYPDSLIAFGDDTMKFELKTIFYKGRSYWHSDSLTISFW